MTNTKAAGISVDPSERLQAAATRLRELAAGATPGPYKLFGDFYNEYSERQEWDVDTVAKTANPDKEEFFRSRGIDMTPGRLDCETDVGKAYTEADARWIAALSPSVAEPVAAMLEAYIPVAQRVESQVSLYNIPDGYDAAIELADTLLR